MWFNIKSLETGDEKQFSLNNDTNIPNEYTSSVLYPDPYLYDWKNENGYKVGIISYNCLLYTNDAADE